MNPGILSHTRPLGRLVRLPLRLVPRKAVVRVLRGRLRGMRWIAGSSINGCWLGTYESDKAALFGQAVREGSVVFDVGAHVGYYTLLSSVLVGSEGRVVAFEPLPANLAYLREHLRLNGVSNVTVVEAAVSDHEGKAFFEEAPSSSMGHISSAGTLEVKLLSLDSQVASGVLPPPDVIKMDIEGAEGSALSGARDVLTRYHPVIFLATHGAGVHADCCTMLESLGYDLQPIGSERLEECSEVLAVFP